MLFFFILFLSFDNSISDRIVNIDHPKSVLLDKNSTIILSCTKEYYNEGCKFSLCKEEFLLNSNRTINVYEVNNINCTFKHSIRLYVKKLTLVIYLNDPRDILVENNTLITLSCGEKLYFSDNMCKISICDSRYIITANRTINFYSGVCAKNNIKLYIPLLDFPENTRISPTTDSAENTGIPTGSPNNTEVPKTGSPNNTRILPTTGSRENTEIPETDFPENTRISPTTDSRESTGIPETDPGFDVDFSNNTGIPKNDTSSAYLISSSLNLIILIFIKETSFFNGFY